MNKEVKMKYDEKEFLAIINAPKNPKGWVIFAHGSGSSRLSKRNNWVASEFETISATKNIKMPLTIYSTVLKT